MDSGAAEDEALVPEAAGAEVESIKDTHSTYCSLNCIASRSQDLLCTKMDYLSPTLPFLFFFLLVSAPFSLSQLTHHDLFCFLEGSGVWFLVFRVSLKGLRLFNIYSQCSSWPSGSSSKSIWIFFFL